MDSAAYLRYSSTTGAEIGMLGPYFGGELFRATAGRNFLSEYVVFGRRGMAATAAAGFYRAETDRFSATFHAPGGTPVRTVRRPHFPARVTVADIAAQRQELARGDEEITRMSPQMATAQRRLRDRLPHRTTLSALTDLRVDRQDNLWIRAYAPPDAPAAPWSVFDPQGHWLGDVAVPAEVQVLEIGDDWMLAKRVDPLDGVERVVLHRIQKPR